MMPICSVPMPTDRMWPDKSCVCSPGEKAGLYRGAFVLFELIVIIVIVAMVTGIAILSLTGAVGRSQFKAEVYELTSMFRMAVTSAAESGRRYEIIIDIPQQTYTLRQITSPDLSQVLDEEIIGTGHFGERCQVLYVQFDDLTRTDEGQQDIAKFRAGRTGWQYGGKIVLMDSDGNEYSIVVNRLSRTIELKPGDVELLVPRYDVPF